MLAAMQYDTFVFPVNPETLHTTYRHDINIVPTTAGKWSVQNEAYLGRTLEGEGMFCGSGAYDSFLQLAELVKDFQPRILRHPKLGAFRAHLTRLELIEEPGEDCLRYKFTFAESPNKV